MQIVLDNVTKYYYDNGKSTKGVENISLTFQTDGSFVVITGESGAGKSTLIRIMTGLDDFDEGEIYFDNKPISGISINEKAEIYSKNISFVFQDYNLVESITARDNIVMALLKRGFSIKECKTKAEEALTKVGLSEQIKTNVNKLSGGEKQRVAIARSLALDAKVIVFDEPTGNLDDSTSKKIIDLIESISQGKLILYVTHDYDLVKDYATRHIVLSDGNVIRDENLRSPAKDIFEDK